MKITLTAYQLSEVWKVVLARRERYRNRPNGHGAAQDAISIQDEVGGFAGELAVAVALGLEWRGGGEDTNGADVGDNIQVRTLTRKTSRRLLVRPYDLRKYGDVPFVLVRRDSDREFTILGWINGDRIRSECSLTDGGNPHRPPVFLIEQKDLLPITTIV